MSSDSVAIAICGDHRVAFFDTQFQKLVREDKSALNPFEELALPHLRGRVLDFGRGMASLAIAAVAAQLRPTK